MVRECWTAGAAIAAATRCWMAARRAGVIRRRGGMKLHALKVDLREAER